MCGELRCMERGEVESLVAEGADAVAAVIMRMEARIAEQDTRIAELEARLGQNSRNSSKPPSSDGYSKPPAKRSLRRASGRKPGGQPGAPGHHLERVETPDERISHAPGGCGAGEADLADAEVLAEGRPARSSICRRTSACAWSSILPSVGAVAVAATSAPAPSRPASRRRRNTGPGCARSASTSWSTSICRMSALASCSATSAARGSRPGR